MLVQVLLCNIRSVHNVGSILRTAEGFGVKKLFAAGYTPLIDKNRPRPGVLPHIAIKLGQQLAKTALGAEKYLPVEYIGSPVAAAEYLFAAKSSGWQILGLENHLQGQKIYPLSSSELKAKLGEKIILVLGEEVAGLTPALIPTIDFFAEIPMFGKKESFNVSVAAAIALYELLGRTD